MKKKLNIAMMGTGFMGKVHSHMWRTVAKIFDVDYEPVLKAAFGTDEKDTMQFAEKWGYESYSLDWQKVIDRDDIDIVDIVAPTLVHKDMAVYAAGKGKSVFCEKPCCLTYKDAKEMEQAAEKAGVLHYLNHNYRRVPAVSYAKQLIEEGKIGEIYHFRGAYLQDWIMDPNFPLTWHLKREFAGGGPLFDLGSHSLDLARFLVGEIASVYMEERTFIKQRSLPGAGAATFTAGSGAAAEKGEVTIDDASFMIIDFEGSSTLGSCDTSRFAGGRRNQNTFEIYGSKGSLVWNLERMNELMYMNLEDSQSEQGFRDIMVTYGSHPYTGNWWAPGHIVGYETTFVNAAYDFLTALKNGTKISPNFGDGARIMRVLEAAQRSSAEGRKVMVSEIV